MSIAQDTFASDRALGGNGRIDAENAQAIRNTKQHSLAPKVSVIVPLYCAEDYVDYLLGWLRSQPLKDIEVICVVDGSPDNSLTLVQRHAEQDSRIRWVYQENAGAGAARNAGLDLARGEYLAFLDADDLYDSQFLVKMYETATAYDADLVVCQFERIDCKTGAVTHGEGFRVEHVPVGKVLASDDLVHPFNDFAARVTNKFFRREMVGHENLRFSETIVANDLYFMLCSIMSSQRIVAIPDNLITVRTYTNPQSISTNRALHSEDALRNLQDLYAWICQHELCERYASSYADVWANAFHYEASHERNERLVETAARILAMEAPWYKMGDEELARVVRLDTSVLDLKRTLARLRSSETVRKVEIERIDNECFAIREVIALLNTAYGKILPERSSLIAGITAHIKRTGLRYNATKIVERVRMRQAIR